MITRPYIECIAPTWEYQLHPRCCLMPWNECVAPMRIWHLCCCLMDTALSQQDPEKSNITVGFFIVLYRIWALFTGTNKDKILSRALFEIFIKIDGLYPFFQCRFYWVFWKSFLTAYLNSWWNFHSFDRSHYILLLRD